MPLVKSSKHYHTCFVTAQYFLKTWNHKEMLIWMQNLNSTSLKWRQIISTGQCYSFARSYQVTRCNR